MKHPYTAPLIQSMLSVETPVNRRENIVDFILGSVVDLATHPVGWNIINACLQATIGIRHQRLQITQEMTEQADIVRNDPYGAQVWKNWKLDESVRKQSKETKGQQLSGKKSGLGQKRQSEEKLRGRGKKNKKR